jgi:hypothetical protein
VEIVTRGLPPDRNRHWIRELWSLRERGDVETFAAYIQQVHPHRVPREVSNAEEYVHCMLRGLLDDL